MQYYKLPSQAVKLTVTNAAKSLNALIQEANGGTYVDLPDSLTGIDLCNDGQGTIRFLPDGNTPTNALGIELSPGEIMKFRNVNPQKFKFLAPGGDNPLQIQLGVSDAGERGLIANSRPGDGGGGGADGALLAANNLGDLTNVPVARTNLDLGTVATLDTGDQVNNVVLLEDAGDGTPTLPAVDARNLTNLNIPNVYLTQANNLSDVADVDAARANIGAGTGDGDLLAANNLSDLIDAIAARQNLGLGSAATKEAGTGAGQVLLLDQNNELPAVVKANTRDGLLVGANNLSDVADAGTSRDNLGLGSSATKNAGTLNGEVLLLDADNALPADIKANTRDGLLAADQNLADLTDAAVARQNLGINNLGFGDLLSDNNLSDLADAGVARTNLGLGTAATRDVGSDVGEVVAMADDGVGNAVLPAVDGSRLTNLTIPDVYLTKADNLASVQDAAAARANIGAGTGDGDMVGANNLSDVADAVQARTNIGAGTGDGDMLSANNLSDVADAATARTNIGAGTGDGDMLGANNLSDVADAAIARTNIGAGTGDGDLLAANNLSDVADAATARTNIGAGTGDGDLLAANNLSDLTDAAVARQNLGLANFGTGDMLAANNLSDVADVDQARTNIGAGTGDGDMLGANNLSDVADAATARANIGAGTGNGDLLAANNLNDIADAATARANIGAGTGDGDMVGANNLSDVTDAAISRDNLGLGTAATRDVGSDIGEVVVLANDGLGNAVLPALDGSRLLNLSIQGDFLETNQNLADVPNNATARDNLGLGTAATKDAGSQVGNVLLILDDGAGNGTLPAIDGSNLTGLGIPEGALIDTNNLSDVQNPAQARANIGAGTGDGDMLGANNLSDVANAVQARTNIGAGTGDGDMLGANNLSDVVNAVQARANIGAGTGDGDMLAANNLSDVADAATARTNIGAGTGDGDMLGANNLNDVADAGVARTNLGLGSSATKDAGAAIGEVLEIIDDGLGNPKLPAIDGSALTNLPIPADALLAANNLNDVDNVILARENLGLEPAAQKNFGVEIGNLVELQNAGDGVTATLPAVDARNLTNLTIPDLYLTKANNLSDVADVATARTNLELGSSATLNAGNAIGEVVVVANDGADNPVLPQVLRDDARSGLLVASNNLSDVTDAAQARANLGINELGAGDMLGANNLSDVADAGLSRDNLGLGTAAVADTGTAIGEVVQVVDDGNGNPVLPVLDGSNLNNLTIPDVYLQKAQNLADVQDAATARANIGAGTGDMSSANNLSDVADVATARTNLQLGTAALEDAGVGVGDLLQIADDGLGNAALPAIDGSNLLNLNIPNIYLRQANNLSDLDNVETAKINLLLGIAADLDPGLAIGNVVQLIDDGTGVTATLPALDARNLTNLTIPDVYLQKANNLSDLDNVILARENLELGTAALKNFGTDIGNLVELQDSGDGVTATLPALDGSNLTNLTIPDVYLTKDNNLSDVTDALTARANIKGDHFAIGESLVFGSDKTRPSFEMKAVQSGDYEIATLQTYRNVEGDPVDRNPFIQMGAQDSTYDKIVLSYAPTADTDAFQGFAVRSNQSNNYLAYLPTFPNKDSMSAEYTNAKHRFLSHRNPGGAAYIETGTAGGTSVLVLNGGRTVNNRLCSYGESAPHLWLNARDGAAITGGYYEQPFRLYTGMNIMRLAVIDSSAEVFNKYNLYCFRNMSAARGCFLPKAIDLRVDDQITPIITIKDETGDCSAVKTITIQGVEQIMGNPTFVMNQPFQKVELYYSIQDNEWKTL